MHPLNFGTEHKPEEWKNKKYLENIYFYFKYLSSDTKVKHCNQVEGYFDLFKLDMEICYIANIIVST